MKPRQSARRTRVLLKRSAVQEMLGIGRSALYEFVGASLVTPPIKASPSMGAGNQLVWWPSDEIEAIQSARIAGYSDAQINALVLKLTAARKRLQVLAPLNADEQAEAA